MLFPTAGIEVNPFFPPLVAFAIAFFTSMGGISGAFLLLPYQVSVLGYVNPSVSATNHMFNLVAIPSGVWRYYREKRLLWPLACIIITGTLPGVFIGTYVRINWLPNPKHFMLFAGVVLLYIGLKMFVDLYKASKKDTGALTKRAHAGQTAVKEKEDFAVHVHTFSRKKLRYSFKGAEYTVATPSLMLLCFFVGIIGGIYGVGGGAFISPFLVSLYGLPVHTIAGATLLGTLLTSATAILFFQILAPYYPNLAIAPDFTLGLLLGLGGMAGMYCGARCQKYVSGRSVSYFLCAVLLGVGIKYLFDAW